MKDEKRQGISIDGETIKSDVPGSKNVIKLYEDIAVIYSDKGEIIRLNKGCLDSFIIDRTWGYYGGNYPYTKISTSKVKELCENYGLAFEAFAVNYDPSKKQQTMYLHRYIMGFYDPKRREEMKERYKDVLLEFGLSSIDELVVDHDTYNARDVAGKSTNQYSDMMRIVPPKVNTAYRVNEAERNNLYKWPILKDESGRFVLEIKAALSPLAKTIGVIVDSDVLARNLTNIVKQMKSQYLEYLYKVFEGFGDIQQKRKAEEEFVQQLIQLARVMEQEGKVKVIMYG